MPRLSGNLDALLIDEINNNEVLCCGEEYNGEGGSVFDGVEERPFALVWREIVFDYALTEADEVRYTDR